MNRPHYSYETFLSFQLADPSGILFYGHLFTLSHQAYEQFVINQLHCPWNEWFQNKNWIVPIKHVEADFFHPILAGQSCQIELFVEQISFSSFTLISSLIQQDTLCCKVKCVHVFCDLPTMKKMAIPDFLLERLTPNTLT